MPVVLCGILPDKFLLHALVLSKGIRLLVGDVVSTVDIHVAEQLLTLFWKHMEEYNGQWKVYNYECEIFLISDIIMLISQDCSIALLTV